MRLDDSECRVNGGSMGNNDKICVMGQVTWEWVILGEVIGRDGKMQLESCTRKRK